MCKAFEDMEKKGRIEGRAEEIVETGYEFGLTEETVMERLRNKLNLSIEEAERYFAMFRRQTV